jgi:hypothetical protein
MCHESVTMCTCYTRSMWMCTFGESVCARDGWRDVLPWNLTRGHFVGKPLLPRVCQWMLMVNYSVYAETKQTTVCD